MMFIRESAVLVSRYFRPTPFRRLPPFDFEDLRTALAPVYLAATSQIS